MTITEAAERWNVSSRRVRLLCEQGLVIGARLEAGQWILPRESPRPVDGRAYRGMDIRKELLPIFREVDALRDELARRRPLTDGEKRRLRDEFTVEYTHDSNAIEGNTLTLSETAMVLEGITIDKKPLKDHLEAVGHRDAFNYLQDIVSKKEPLTEWFIRELHYMVLADRPADRGVYRRIPVKILGAVHEPPPPEMVPEQMRDLLSSLKGCRLHPIESAAIFHIRFEAIHPFIDGNGRTGRLLMNFLLMQAGYPPINVKYADRRRYYDAFTSYHRDNDDSAMILLVAEYVKTMLRNYLDILG